jgi:ethanolamine permease
MIAAMQSSSPGNSVTGGARLQPVLGTVQLWGIAVGLVISGEYFGWSYGWSHAGTLGFAAVTLAVALMYTAFIFSLTELTTAIPRAGGPFTYCRRAFGDNAGWVAGMATLVEFVFAPPAIALAIGAYVNGQFPAMPARQVAVAAFALFMVINILGVRLAAVFELTVTLLAVGELLVFIGVVSPAFSWTRFAAGGWAGQDTLSAAALPGMLAAVPFAIWFFLAIEGVAMAAEEASDPRRSIPRAYLGGITTLVLLAFGVMLAAGGAADWREYANVNDPLPRVMAQVTGADSVWLRMLVSLGVLGLVASLHGIVLGYSRQIYALARDGFLPRALGRLHPRFQTPHRAVLAGGAVGLAAIFADEWLAMGGQSLTANIVTVSVMGALVMYIACMLALLRLRQVEPDLPRPFHAPLYPWLPLLALAGALVCLATLVVFNPVIAAVFAAMLCAGVAVFRLCHHKEAT